MSLPFATALLLAALFAGFCIDCAAYHFRAWRMRRACKRFPYSRAYAAEVAIDAVIEIIPLLDDRELMELSENCDKAKAMARRPRKAPLAEDFDY
jgi:hypothetical protein